MVYKGQCENFVSVPLSRLTMYNVREIFNIIPCTESHMNHTECESISSVQKYCLIQLLLSWHVQFLTRAPMSSSSFSKVVSVVDLLAVVPVQALHLRVHDALIGRREHLGRGHVLVVPRVAVASL